MSTIWHESDCTRPAPIQKTGRQGDLLESCPECGRYIVGEWAAASVGAPQTGCLPAIPPAPQPFRAGWPTHRARRRLRARRGTR